MNSSIGTSIALGETVITVAARQILHPQEVLSALWRHANEPWGASFEPEAAQTVREDRRLVSNHMSASGPFKVVTETEKGVTTVFLAYEKDLSRVVAVQESALQVCQGCGA